MSVLDKAAEDRALMGLSGMTFHSAGLHEPDPDIG